MRTLAEERGAYTPQLLLCHHVVDGDPVFINELRENSRTVRFVRELYVLIPAMCRAPVLSTKSGTMSNICPNPSSVIMLER